MYVFGNLGSLSLTQRHEWATAFYMLTELSCGFSSSHFPSFPQLTPHHLKIAKEILSKQTWHQHYTSQGGFIQGNHNRAERPKLRQKSARLKKWKGELLRCGKGTCVLLLALPEGKWNFLCSFMTGGSSCWSKGHPKVRLLLVLDY